nr:ATP-binding protein [Catellatospora sp. TT07R-123]
MIAEIGDDGPGMPPAVLAHAFEAFYTTKDVGRGTGLGLDIARRLRRGDIMMVMRSPRKAGRQALVMSVLWRVLVWLLVSTVLACAIGGWALPEGDPLFRVGAIAFAVIFGYIAIRFELMMRSAGRSDQED